MNLFKKKIEGDIRRNLFELHQCIEVLLPDINQSDLNEKEKYVLVKWGSRFVTKRFLLCPQQEQTPQWGTAD